VKLDIRKRAWAVSIALAGLTISCGRQPDFVAGQSLLQDRALPFHPDPNAKGLTRHDTSYLAGVAPGTPILVHLQAPLSSARSRAGDSFKAILDEAIVVRGQTIVVKGALITGKILEAKPSDPDHEAGYLRLTLTEISLDGKSWPLQTSNVFVKGATYERDAPAPPIQLVGDSKSLTPKAAPRVVRIEVREEAGVPADRHLTFRLTQPVSLENSGQ
jgi:hypothetical protein